jgi:hypothetical protein
MGHRDHTVTVYNHRLPMYRRIVVVPFWVLYFSAVCGLNPLTLGCCGVGGLMSTSMWGTGLLEGLLVCGLLLSMAIAPVVLVLGLLEVAPFLKNGRRVVPITDLSREQTARMADLHVVRHEIYGDIAFYPEGMLDLLDAEQREKFRNRLAADNMMMLMIR